MDIRIAPIHTEHHVIDMYNVEEGMVAIGDAVPYCQDQMEATSYLPEVYLDLVGEEYLGVVSSNRSAVSPDYFKYLETRDPPEHVARLLGDMGWEMEEYDSEPYTVWMVHGHPLSVSADPDLYPVLGGQPPHTFESTDGEREWLLSRRKALDVYDTLLRSCWA